MAELRIPAKKSVYLFMLAVVPVSYFVFEERLHRIFTAEKMDLTMTDSALLVVLACLVLVTLYMIPRLLSNKPPLILSDKGLLDQSPAPGYGFIPWDFITHVRMEGQEPYPKLLVFIKTERVNDVVANAKHESMTERNAKKHGTPVVFDLTMLAIQPVELQRAINDFMMASPEGDATEQSPTDT